MVAVGRQMADPRKACHTAMALFYEPLIVLLLALWFSVFCR